ncbi:MAG: hypothetical protein ACRC1Z_00995, partial [Waterburya sp.]
ATQLLGEQPVTIARSDLEAVAIIDDSKFSELRNALDLAYVSTQNEKEDWWMNTDIALREIEERSTSMGDVIEANGEFWIVAMTGFRQCTVI